MRIILQSVAMGLSLVFANALAAQDLPGIERIVLSDDGRLALLAAREGQVHLYDPIRKVVFRSLNPIAGSQPATTMAIAPPDEMVAVSGERTPVKWLSMKSGRTLRMLSNRTPATCVALAPDGKSLAASLVDGRVVIWNLADYQVQAELADVHAVQVLRWSNNGKLLAIATEDSELLVWFPSQTKTLLKLRSPRELSKLKHVAFSPDGRQLFTVTAAQYALWDVAGGKLAQAFDGRLGSGDSQVHGVAWNPARNQAVDLTDKSFRAWNLTTGEIVRELPADLTPHDAAFSRDGTKVLYRPRGQLNTGALVYRDLGAELGWPTGTPAATAVAGTTNPTSIGTAGERSPTALTLPKLTKAERNFGEFHLNGDVVRVAGSAAPGAPPRRPAVSAAVDLQAAINSTGLSDDGKTIVAGGDKGELFVGDFDTGKIRSRFWIADNERLRVVQPSPDGKMFAVAYASDSVELWTDRGVPVAKLPVDHEATALAFSPLGTYLAVATDDNVAVFRLADRSWYATLRVRPPVQAIAISPDEHSIAIGFGTVCVWNLSNDSVSWCLPVAQEVVSAVAYSPDGKYVAVGDRSGAGFVHLCDAVTGRTVAQHSSRSPITAIAFQSPTKLVFASGQSREVTTLSVPDAQVLGSSPHPGVNTPTPIYDQFVLSRDGRRGVFNPGRSGKMSELKAWKAE